MLIENDFSQLWTKTDNSIVYGFVGDKHQRLRIKFLNIEKMDNAYTTTGKLLIKDALMNFEGMMQITNIRKYQHNSAGVDNEFKNKVKGEYAITGNYVFYAHDEKHHVHKLKGIFQSDFYLDMKNKVHYDDLDIVSDSFSNNQFVGTWKDVYKNTTSMCNWGDYRIPNSGNFDIGAGDFSPNTKDISLGWQSIIDCSSPDKRKRDTAQKIEKSIWWH